MLKGLQGKTVLVTGAAGGIGRAACDRFLAEGARVVAIDLDDKELRGAYPRDTVECVAADLTKAAGAAACVSAAERFGGLDLAFLNAGVEGIAASVIDFSEKNYDHVFNINVRGSFLCAQAVARHMLKRGKGGILFTSSIAGLKCNPSTAIYNASKHAVVGLAKCLASEVGTQGIRVNVLCPGVVDTRMMHSLEVSMGAASGVSTETMAQLMRGNALGRYGTPEEIASIAAWILSDEAPFCHGETFTIGGGLMAS
jgi:NAD(P)-dependent dehydrogenase (short-subunit alcohol dehydrogenase family)